jgi:hypothetical protein
MTIGRIPSVEGGIQPTIVDAKGDLIAATAADTVNRLAVGSNGQVLTADSTQSTGLKWAAPDPLTTKGDLFTYSTTEARLPVGANGTVLTADSAEATGLKWATPSAPSFVGCSVNWTDQNIANNTETTIIWYNEDFDTSAFHDTSTNQARITIPSGLGGKYLIQTKGSMPTGASAYAATVRIKKNGNDFKANNFVVPTTGSVSFVMSEVHSLSVGDYLTITVLQSSGGTRTLSLGEYGYFGVTYLGA